MSLYFIDDSSNMPVHYALEELNGKQFIKANLGSDSVLTKNLLTLQNDSTLVVQISVGPEIEQ